MASELGKPATLHTATNFSDGIGWNYLVLGMGAGLAVSIAAASIEGILLGRHDAALSLEEWLYAIALYAWWGLLLGLVLAAFLRMASLRLRGTARRFCAAMLIPGLIFLFTFIVGGYWLNSSGIVPPFDTREGKLLTGAIASAISLVCLALTWVLSRLQMKSLFGRGTAIALLALGAALVSVPPIAIWRNTDATAMATPGDVVADAPPVFVILIDTLRKDHVSCFSDDRYGRSITPNISSLAADGFLFLDSHTTSNWTVPSVATLHTGLYPSTHGVLSAETKLGQKVRTLSEAFQQAGYRTGFFVANPHIRPETGYNRGVDFFIPEEPPRWTYHRRTAIESVAIRLGTTPRAARAYTLVDRSLAWLSQNPSRPAFLYLHLLEPHAPYDLRSDGKDFLPAGANPDEGRWPPLIENFREKGKWLNFEEIENPPVIADKTRETMVALYDGEIAYTDRFVGEFLSGLRELGIYDDAVVVLLSDHGEEFGDHGGWTHGLTLYEEMTAMPLVIKMHENVGAGLRVTDPVDMVDVFPTLCGIVGMEPPPQCQGTDYSGLLFAMAGSDVPVRKGSFATDSGRTSDAVDPDSVMVGNSSADWAASASLTMMPPQLYALREGRWKLVERNRDGVVTDGLFDLTSDPLEQTNLSATYPDTIALLRTHLRTLVRENTVTGAEGLADEDLDPETRRMLRSLGHIN